MLTRHGGVRRQHRLIAALAATTLWFWDGAPVRAEVLVRWDHNQIPAPASLGIPTIVIPAASPAAVRSALAQGYRVYLELDASALSTFVPPADAIAGVVVNGAVSSRQLAALQGRLKPGVRVISVDARAKWPHIRSNWVTRNNEVLQVSSRSAQPWIENNAALLTILKATASAGAAAKGTSNLPAAWVSYPWQPITLSEIDDGPQLENYLVAIAEAGSFGGDLVLPLHRRFQEDLVLGLPQARAGWNRIRRHIEFYSWDLPGRYQPIANIGVLTRDAMPHFEVLNLLARHNLPFELIADGAFGGANGVSYDLVIALDTPAPAQLESLAAFAAKGGTVVLDATLPPSPPSAKPATVPTRPWGALTPVQTSDERVSYAVGEGRVVEVRKGIGDPNRFALEMRQLLGPSHRVLDIWNGITVIAAAYRDPGGRSVLVSVLNYAHQSLPVQLRIAGSFSLVQYESAEGPAALIPYHHRDGYTEVVLPALGIGGRLFLSH